MIIADEEVAWAYLLSPEFELTNTAGKPLTGGWLEVYVHGTRTKYYCASDWTGTLHPFQIPLDSLGSNIVLASPANAYDVYVYSKFGSLVMSRYNVQPKLGAGEIVHDEITVSSNDGTVNVEASGNTNYDLSIADTVSAVSALQDAVSGLDIRIQDLETEVSGIEVSLDGKKDLQSVYEASGTVTQTITNVTQDEQGVITVTYQDIDLPSEVPNIDIVSPNGSLAVSSVVDPETNIKTFSIDVNSDNAVYWQGSGSYITVLDNSYHILPISNVPRAKSGNDITVADNTVVMAKGTYYYSFNVTLSRTQSAQNINQPIYIYVGNNCAQVELDRSYDGGTITKTVCGLINAPYNDYELQCHVRTPEAYDFVASIYDVSIFKIESFSGYVSGGAGEYEPGWGIEIGGQIISVDSSIIPDVTTVSGMIQEAVSGMPESRYNPGPGINIDDDTNTISVNTDFVPTVSAVSAMVATAIAEIPPQEQSDWTEDDNTLPSFIQNKPAETELVPGDNISITVSGTSAIISASVPAVTGFVTEQELVTVSGNIVAEIPDVSDFATHDEVNTVSGEIVNLIPDTSDFATHDEVNTVSGAIVSLIPSVEITPTLASGTKIAEYSIDGVSGIIFAPQGGGSSDIFFAEYGVTTFNEIWSAATAGKVVYAYTQPVTPTSETIDYLQLNYIEKYSDSNAKACFVQTLESNNTIYTNIATVNSYNIWGWNGYHGNYVPEPSYNSGYVLTEDGLGHYSWVAPRGGSSYTAGDYISIENDVIAVTGIDPMSFASQADLEAVSAAIPTVEITPTLASGVKIAEYSINGVTGELFTPEVSGGDGGALIAVYNSTTLDEIKAAYDAGKAIFMKYPRSSYEDYLYPLNAFAYGGSLSTKYAVFKGPNQIKAPNSNTVQHNVVFTVNANSVWSTEIDVNDIPKPGNGDINKVLTATNNSGAVAWRTVSGFISESASGVNLYNSNFEIYPDGQAVRKIETTVTVTPDYYDSEYGNSYYYMSSNKIKAGVTYTITTDPSVIEIGGFRLDNYQEWDTIDFRTTGGSGNFTITFRTIPSNTASISIYPVDSNGDPIIGIPLNLVGPSSIDDPYVTQSQLPSGIDPSTYATKAELQVVADTSIYSVDIASAVVVSALPQDPVSSILYLIPEA